MWFGERSNAPLQSSSVLRHSLQALWSGHFVGLFVFPCRVCLRKRGVVPQGADWTKQKAQPMPFTMTCLFPRCRRSHISHTHVERMTIFQTGCCFVSSCFLYREEFEIFWWTHLLSSREFVLHFHCIGTCVSLYKGKTLIPLELSACWIWSYQQQAL